MVAVTHRSTMAGAVLLLAGATSAGAADLYRGMKDPYMPAASHPVSWYVRGDYSYSWMDVGNVAMPSFAFSPQSIDNTWALGGGIGRYFGRGVRGDVTYEWRGSVDVQGGGTPSTDLDVKSSVILANLYYDFRAGERLTPYIGVGLGAAHHETSGGSVVSSCGSVCVYGGSKNWTPAGALMAGLSWRIDRGAHAPVSIKDDGYAASAPGRLHLDVGYRFLYLGDTHAGSIVGVTPTTPGPRIEDMTSHEIRVGVRWDLR